MRNITINNKEFSYVVGKDFVVIKDENNRYNVPITSITGETWEYIERAR